MKNRLAWFALLLCAALGLALPCEGLAADAPAGVTAATPLPCQPPAAGATPIESIVESAMRDVLVWKPVTSDPRGFVAAFSQSLTTQQVEGAGEWSWPPHAPDAQATLARRASEALGRALKLLEDLQPAIADHDQVALHDVRIVVRDDIQSVAAELMRKGGPRDQKGAQVFGAILGAQSKSVGIVEVKGSLHALAGRLGLDPDRVGSVEEQQNLSRFLILADYMSALETSWRHASNLDTGRRARPGDPVAAVTAALAVAAESVDEVRFAMDAAWLGPAERQTLPMCFRGEKQLSLSELLAGAERFVGEAGPRLAREGGRDGMAKVEKQAGQLAGLMAGAMLPTQDAARMPAGYRTASVQRAFKEAAEGLAAAAGSAKQALAESGKGKRKK